MSLHHIAQHLKDQGRGPDDMLVHMTHGEVKALQGLAQAHGGSLTVNPHTGLPEAGFLSSVLPMALGAAAVATGQLEFLPYIAAGVGVADYALTGSLQQGLMAGLGTWSGGTLAGGLGAAGAAEIAAEGGNAATAAYQKSLEQIGANGAQIPAGAIPTEMGTYNPTTGAEVTTQSLASDAVSKAGLKAAQESALQQAIQAGGNTSEIVGAAGRLGTTPTITEGLARGISSPSAIGETIMNNKMALAGAAAPALSGALTKQPTVPGSTAQKNPFGLKTIPRDENGNPIFNASLPTPPSPAYQPVYPNYQTNPYRPVGAAEGGVMKMAVGGSAPQIGTPAQNTTMDSSVGNNTMFPMSEMARSYYATPTQLPAGINAQNNPNPAGQSNAPQIPGYGPKLDTNTGQMINNFADGGLANLPYVQQSQNQPSTSNGYTPAGGGSTYGQGQYSPQTMARPTMGLDPSAPFSQMGMPTQFAQGGIAQYAGKYESMVSGLHDVQEGAEMATKRPLMDTPRPDFGVYEDESDIRNLDAYNRTQALFKKALTSAHVKPSKGLPKAAVLGSIDMTPAAQAAAEAQAKQAIAKESDTSEAKEGGVIGMAFGGMSNMTQTADPSIAESKTRPNGFLSGLVWDSIHPQNQYSNKSVRTFTGSQPSIQGNVYQPSYTNYAQSPYQAQPMLNPAQLQAASQAYLNQGIPTPTRTMSAGGLSMGGHLGGYSDGGHLLKGPGDGVSDSIPATIGGKQPARLAEGEFVIPARIVSELGNGSTDAGAKRLYAMMDRIKAKRRKTKNIAADTKAYKYLPA
jgi:hypothetical protein